MLREDMSPKPAYTALKELIKSKWWTKAAGKVNSQGQVQFRGFYGEYKLTFTTPDGQEVTGTFTIEKDKRDPVQVNLAKQ